MSRRKSAARTKTPVRTKSAKPSKSKSISIKKSTKKKAKKKVRDVSDDQLERYRLAFAKLDTNRSNTLDVAEIHAAMRTIGLKCSISNVWDMILEGDEDGDLELDFDEFVKLMELARSFKTSKAWISAYDKFVGSTSQSNNKGFLFEDEDPSRFDKVDEDGDTEEAPVSTKPKTWSKVWGGRALAAYTVLVMCQEMITIHDPFLLFLVAANVGLYIYQFFIQWKGQKNHWETNGINKKNAGVKSLFLSTFSHGDLLHLAGNMGGLIGSWNVVLQYGEEGAFGLLIVYVVAGIGGTFAALKMTPKATTMGASGAVYGVVAARTVIQGDPSGMMQWLITDTLRTILERPGVSWSGHLGGGLAGGMVAIVVFSR